MNKKILSVVLCLALCISMMSMLAGCGGGKADAFVIMTDQLDGLFNPFYSTSANDGSIVGMTQIGMIGADYQNGEIKVAYGENEAVVVKDYEIVENANKTTTCYDIHSRFKTMIRTTVNCEYRKPISTVFSDYACCYFFESWIFFI